MNAEKTAYWLALAAFGFALLGVCPRGALQNLNHALGHAGLTLCRLASNAERAVIASALISHPQPRANDSWSGTDAVELAHAQIEQAKEQAEQVREQALAKADAMREEALAKAEATRQQALAQAAVARAEVELQRAEIQQLRVHIRPQVRFSRAANWRMLISSSPCASVVVRKAIDLSDAEERTDAVVSNAIGLSDADDQ
jgi:F0F1-type ATP synthase membrane subunit b/b'